MARRLLSSGSNLNKHIAESPNGRDRPRVSLRAERRFHLADKSLGRKSVAIHRVAKNTADQLRSGFDSCIGGRDSRRMRRPGLKIRRSGLLRLGLFAAQFELQPPAMRGVPRFTSEFERAHLRKTGPEMHIQVQLAHFLAVAQQGHQRSMTMHLRFVQRSDFAVRVMPCARTVQRE